MDTIGIPSQNMFHSTANFHPFFSDYASFSLSNIQNLSFFHFPKGIQKPPLLGLSSAEFSDCAAIRCCWDGLEANGKNCESALQPEASPAERLSSSGGWAGPTNHLGRLPYVVNTYHQAIKQTDMKINKTKQT